VTFSAPSAAGSRCELTDSSSIITTQHIQDIRPWGLHSTTGCFQTSVGKVSGDISAAEVKHEVLQTLLFVVEEERMLTFL